MHKISSWGRLNKELHEIIILRNPNQIHTEFPNTKTKGIFYGMGKSYGDVCLNPKGILWKTENLNKFINFDIVTGRIICESGILLKDIQRLVMPYGWRLPVTPGTQYITLGGAIANDVHGKNHHFFGSFGNHVKSINLMRTNGEQIECSPNINHDWFSATIGGMGLTGLITQAEIQLVSAQSSWLQTETLAYSTLDEFIYLSDSSENNWEHTVAWVDCNSKKERGIFMRANSIDLANVPAFNDKKIRIPFTPPISMINKFSLKIINRLYFNLKKYKLGYSIHNYEKFLYPLDNILNWNKLYGPKGFFQYQAVFPKENGIDAIRAILQETMKNESGSFLNVLKTFGNKKSLGMMSFPQPGITLSIDFPNKGKETLKLFQKFDKIIYESGGKIYLAKDARCPSYLFEIGYPLYSKFKKYRDPGISSGLSKRLMEY